MTLFGAFDNANEYAYNKLTEAQRARLRKGGGNMEQRGYITGSGGSVGHLEGGGDGASGQDAEARLGVAPIPGWTAKDTARFWSKVDRGGGPESCWFWTRMGANGNAYGTFWVNGRLHHAHRIAWSLEHNNWPGRLFVCHRCDQRACCNPVHLFVGTHADNMKDMVAKGRHVRAGGKKPGAFDVRNKLTADLARQVFNAHGMYKDIAERFGVCRQTVSDVKLGRRWGHVTAVERHLRAELAAWMDELAAEGR